MNKSEIIKTLAEIGIKTTNAYPKFVIRNGNGTFVSLFSDEFADDFFFYNSLDQVIYKIPATSNFAAIYGTEDHRGTIKYLVPENQWFQVYPKLQKASETATSEDYKELEDCPMKELTGRDYASIHLGVPRSNKPWLNELIKSIV